MDFSLALPNVSPNLSITNERERKSGYYNLYTYYYFRKSSFWYLRDLNPGERNRERKR